MIDGGPGEEWKGNNEDGGGSGGGEETMTGGDGGGSPFMGGWRVGWWSWTPLDNVETAQRRWDGSITVARERGGEETMMTVAGRGVEGDDGRRR